MLIVFDFLFVVRTYSQKDWGLVLAEVLQQLKKPESSAVN
jgi:hypothetical protein